MARLLTRTRTRLAVKRTATKQKNRFQTKKRTHLAGVISGGLAVVDGQLYGTGADSAGVIDVVNLGRAAAALYVPENGSGSVTLAGGSGSCSDGGSGGVGVHALDGPYHTGTLAQSQAPWAALDSDLQDHIADDIHHERLHNILNTDDHEVTAARYSVLGTPNAANALAMWLTDEDGTPGNVLLRSDSDGNARLNALFAYNRVQSQSFASGFGGNGYRLDYGVATSGRSTLEVDNVSIRGRLTVRELLIRKIRTTNGDIFVSSGGTVQSVTEVGGGYWDLVFKEDAGLLEDDLIAAQAWTGAGVYRIEATVTAVTDSTHIRILVNSGDDPDDALAAANSLDFARHGSTSDTDRQGLIYLTSDDTGGPFIRVVDGIDSWADWGTAAVLKVQLGQLDGITDATLGDLSGYGLYGQNVYLTGILAAGGGDAVLGDDGLNIQAGTSSDGGWTNHSDKLTFAEDPMATLDDANVIGQLGANRFVSGSDVVRRVAMRVNAGADSSTDQARIGLEAYWIDAEADVPIQSAAIQMIGEEGAPSISLRVQGSTANAGTITLDTPVLNVSGHIRMTGGGDIGTALDPVGTLYADELVVGTTYTNNTGFVNDIRYYPRTELNTYLDNTFEPLGHSHPGLITSADLTDTLVDYATIAYVDAEIAGIPAPDLSNYWTKAQADGRYTQVTTYNGHVAATNPHGTTLASLTERNYSSLTSRGHLLASASGLGPDHTVSGATDGQVLQATGATTAKFRFLSYTHLIEREHLIADTTGLGTDHAISDGEEGMVLRVTGPSTANLGFLYYDDLIIRQHDIVGGDHEITAARYSVVGTPDAADTLAAWATSADGAGNPGAILRSDASGNLAINLLNANTISAGTIYMDSAVISGDAAITGALDVTGLISGKFGTIQAAVDDLNIYGDTITLGDAAGTAHTLILEDGTIRSTNYVAGISGYNISQDVLEANNAEIRGVLRSGMLQALGSLWSYGTQIFGPAGKLRSALAIEGPGAEVTLAVDYDERGPVAQFAEGDFLLLAGPAYVEAVQREEDSMIDVWTVLQTPAAVELSTNMMASVWLEVNAGGVSDTGTHFEYTCTVMAGPRSAWSAGSTVGSYGDADTGRISITADRAYAPYLRVATTGATPWAGTIPHLQIGKLDGLAVGAADRTPGEYGQASAADLRDATGAWLITSNQRVASNNITATWTDGDSSITIDPEAGMRVSTSPRFAYENNRALTGARLDWYDPDGDTVFFRIGPGTDDEAQNFLGTYAAAYPLSIVAEHVQKEWANPAIEIDAWDATIYLAVQPSESSPGSKGASISLYSRYIFEPDTASIDGQGGGDMIYDDGYISISAPDGIALNGPVKFSTSLQMPAVVHATDLPTSTLDLDVGRLYIDPTDGAIKVMM
ncbi:MAG: hypothetical protein H6644_17540 [Caldilineaceae bacterium]|nr:hypothetical protein [Caldilineaceae bacterium]